MPQKIGESSRKNIMELVKNCLIENGYDVLLVASGSYGIPVVEDGEEGAVKIVFQIPKGERGGNGYDVFEEADAHKFKCEQKEIKAKEKAEKKKKE